MNKIVYVVTHTYSGFDGDESTYTDIEGVFSTEEKAYEYIAKQKAEGFTYGFWDVIDIKLDEE